MNSHGFLLNLLKVSKIMFVIVFCLFFVGCSCNKQVAVQVVKPYQHSYDIVIKEKFIVYDGHTARYLFRYYNKTTNKHYMLENYDSFVKFDIGEPLILQEKYDGVNYTGSLTSVAKEIKAEAEN